MSQANVNLVRRGIESVETFWALLDEHVVWDLRGRAVLDLDDVYVGRDAVVKACRHYWGTWHEYQLDAEEFIDAGSSVVVSVRERGRGRGSGAPFDQRWAQVWTFSRGRVIRWELFPDTARALEAVGLLSESPTSQANVALVRRVFEGWSGGDLSVEAEGFDDNVVFVVSPDFPAWGVHTGRERLRGYMREFLAQWEFVSYEATRLRAFGDTVVVDVVQHSRGRASGIEGELRYYMLFTFRGRKIVRYECVMQEREALEAVGLAVDGVDRSERR